MQFRSARGQGQGAGVGAGRVWGGRKPRWRVQSRVGKGPALPVGI